MKTLFLSNMGLAPLHLGTELELINQAHERQDEIYILKCDAGYSSCYFNPCHNLIGCAICTARTNRFHQLFNLPKNRIFTIQPFSEKAKFKLPKFNNLTDLMAYEINGINIGRGVASSVISLERDYAILSNERQQELINIQLEMAVNAFLNYKEVIQKVKPDQVYLFNGRFAEQFPMIEYCKKIGLKFFTHERGSSPNKYQLFEDTLPHSIKARQNIMNQLWKERQIKNADRIAQNWFQVKRKGKNLDDKSYLKRQKENQLPNSFNPKKHNIAIFNSSEDEMKAIGEWENPLYKNQNEAIRSLITFFAKENPQVHFTLRMHPNLGKVDNQQTKELYALQSPNFTLIEPFEQVDSYALIDACNQTLTFGSTIGIEATYWGKASILFGKSFYDNLNCVYQPTSYEALFNLINTTGLSPKPTEHTFKFAYFMAKFGIDFRQFQYDGKWNSSFKGIPLKRVTIHTISKLFLLLKDFPLWWKLNKIIFNRRLNFKDLFRLKSHTVND